MNELSQPSQNDPIDRVAPTLRPPGRPVMYQRWAKLLFLHWVVPADSLRPLLPPGLELDTFEDRAYIGLVPFTMTGVRPAGTPSFPPLSNFHETNVRTYVHRGGRDPGVWFFSLDAANAFAVRLARVWFKLPYFYARMRLSEEAGSAPDTHRVCYSTERLWPDPVPACCSVRYEPTGPVAPAKVGTLEHFLVERYILYATARGRLFSGHVHHPAYPLQTAVVSDLKESMIAAAGVTRPDTPPLVHYAREVRVHIFGLKAI